MIIKSENYDDGHRYYNGTYIATNAFEGTSQFYKVLFPGGGDIIFYSLTSGKKFSYNVKDQTESVEIGYILPGKTLGMFTDDSGIAFAILLTRKLDKQYKRVLSSENADFWVAKDSGWSAREVSDKTIKVWQNRVDIQVSGQRADLVKGLSGKTNSFVSAAFSDCVTLTRAGGVFVYETSVGFVDYTNKLVTCNPLFHNEVANAVGEFFKIVSYRSERKGTR